MDKSEGECRQLGKQTRLHKLASLCMHAAAQQQSCKLVCDSALIQAGCSRNAFS